MDYEEFLKTKEIGNVLYGFEPASIPDKLFPFQRDIVTWACRRGRAAIFADCGMGKTAMQLSWASEVVRHSGGKVMIFAPLAVSSQTVNEGKKFGIAVKYCRSQDQVEPGITISNYEMAEHFNPSLFSGIVLDESSILKSYTGKFKTYMLEQWGRSDYRLACTATPAPNDHMELGNHSEFLGVMRGSEMLASFFINDPSNVGHYRIKGHAQEPFWKWMCSWAVMIQKPSDIGYEDCNFILPALKMNYIEVDAMHLSPPVDQLFRIEARLLSERQKERRETTELRISEVCKIVDSDKENQWLLWCDTNAESDALKKAIAGSVEVKGSDSADHKERSLVGFSNGSIRILITKPSIAGFGMNFQSCNNVVFVGLSDSYESFYQAIRRCWRFGQKRAVNCYVVTSNTEGNVSKNIRAKEERAKQLTAGMVASMAKASGIEVKKDKKFTVEYKRQFEMEMPKWISK